MKAITRINDSWTEGTTAGVVSRITRVRPGRIRVTAIGDGCRVHTEHGNWTATTEGRYIARDASEDLIVPLGLDHFWAYIPAGAYLSICQVDVSE